MAGNEDFFGLNYLYGDFMGAGAKPQTPRSTTQAVGGQGGGAVGDQLYGDLTATQTNNPTNLYREAISNQDTGIPPVTKFGGGGQPRSFLDRMPRIVDTGDQQGGLMQHIMQAMQQQGNAPAYNLMRPGTFGGNAMQGLAGMWTPSWVNMPYGAYSMM